MVYVQVSECACVCEHTFHSLSFAHFTSYTIWIYGVHHRHHRHHHRSTALYKIFIRFDGRPSYHSLMCMFVCMCVCVRTFSVYKYAWCEMPLCTFRFALDFNPIKIVCAPFYCCCCCYCWWWCSDCRCRRCRCRRRQRRRGGSRSSLSMCV